MVVAGEVQLRAEAPSSALPSPGEVALPRFVEESNVVPGMVTLYSPGSPASPASEEQEEPPAPRTYFPETWLWDLVPVG